MKKYQVGIVGATGMVGQRFVSLLAEHPWFEVKLLAASGKSAGKPYAEAVAGRWAFPWPVPAREAALIVQDSAHITQLCQEVDFVFCAVNLPKEETKALELAIARTETPVISNNSALRLAPDVPMMIPEINLSHAEIIPAQKKRLGTARGFVAVKPNCSIQSYVPALSPLWEFQPKNVFVCTYQAISGAGKTFETWPDMIDNVIPYIAGEEEKSEQEPLKIWGHLENGAIVNAGRPAISAQCIRVPVLDGHTAAVSVQFAHPPSIEQVLEKWETFAPATDGLSLPSAPQRFLTYFEDPARPQTQLDRDLHHGMGISMGRLRQDPIFDLRFVCLSHNTLRGAAGGGVLSAEALCKLGYIPYK